MHFLHVFKEWDEPGSARWPKELSVFLREFTSTRPSERCELVDALLRAGMLSEWGAKALSGHEHLGPGPAPKLPSGEN
ncbi:hypothetical protein GCM10025778_32090 [Paeniglutamicibacter antarcticus]|uniref:Uncharacterized protein n=1 Tax=Paeniglutamicibacter antarcticus TaxID=494023 RepID=A0ABP9TUP2_9MICC